MHEKHGVPLNKLYSYGFSRVGCFPCINSNKREVRLISIHFPERIEQIREQEQAGFGPGGRYQSFFHARTTPARFHSETYINRKGIKYSVAMIDDVVRWSHTGYRAMPRQPMLFDDFYDDDKTLVCPSGAGMCE